jgi:hypothetical protein
MSLFGKPGEFYSKKDHIQYLDDYEIRYVKDEKGREKKEIVYIGPMIPVQEDKKRLRIKLPCAAVLAVLAVFTVLSAVFTRHVGGLIAELPLIISLFPCLYLIMGIFLLPYSGKPMKRDVYMHGMIRVFRSCGALTVLMGIVLVIEILRRITQQDTLFLRDDVLFIVRIVGAIALSVLIILILRSVEIDEKELILGKEK